MSIKLDSIPTLVESPFIIVKLGGVTFGSYSGSSENWYSGAIKVEYPNFMRRLSVEKVNGTVNIYTIDFVYQVRPGDDPNLLDKIFSRATKDRKIILTYGDWNSPSYIYREEEALITNVTSSLDMSSSSISYTVSCTSSAVSLGSTLFTFPSTVAKPSDVLLNMLTSKKYGLSNVFTGMTNKDKILSNNLLSTNDREVRLSSQVNVSPLDYMNYLVDCMSNQDSKNSAITGSKYFMTIHDDYNNNLGGTYFKVTEVSSNTKVYDSASTYEIDINYPGDNFVTSFSLSNDQSWALLYEYSSDIQMEQYMYSRNPDGTYSTIYSPKIMRSNKTGEISPAKASWWTQMTQFPISASLTIKGLTRPSILMSQVRLNVMFNGGIKHISSGLYVITKQIDTVDDTGYKTTLSLLRIGGDQ